MGSAALGEAIKGIRDWAMTEGRKVQTPAQVKDIFGMRVFNALVDAAILLHEVKGVFRRYSGGLLNLSR